MCKTCWAAYMSGWYQANKDHVQARRFGMTELQMLEMLEAQDWRCAICRVEPDDAPYGRLQVDHDHKCCPQNRKTCGKCNRGMLCANCNKVLGYAKDDPKVLLAAQHYLER